MSYYETVAKIRYYGQIPETVARDGDEVLMSGITSTVFGKNIPEASWEELLHTARKEPVDLSRRETPPHDDLANLKPDVDSLRAFTRRWGPLSWDNEPATGRTFTTLNHILPHQSVLRRAWKGNPHAVAEMERDVKTRLDIGRKSIEIAVVDLWSLVRVLFLRDHKIGLTKVCGNPDCDSAFFLQQREGQKFCSHKCAVLMNVRRFRERQAKGKSRPK